MIFILQESKKQPEPKAEIEKNRFCNSSKSFPNATKDTTQLTGHDRKKRSPSPPSDWTLGLFRGTEAMRLAPGSVPGDPRLSMWRVLGKSCPGKRQVSVQCQSPVSAVPASPSRVLGKATLSLTGIYCQFLRQPSPCLNNPRTCAVF